MNNFNKSIKSKKLSKNNLKKNESILDNDITVAIASKIISTTPAPEVAKRIKTKLMKRITNQDQVFKFATQAKWKEILPGVKMRLLSSENNTKSFLLDMAAHTSIPAHKHDKDEESFVVKGKVYIEGILCNEGDYHFARAGTMHQIIRTEQGCTLLVKNI